MEKPTSTSAGTTPHRGPDNAFLFEWPTVALLAGCYASFGVLTVFAGSLGLLATVPLLAMVLTLHSSLQHEILHGHPFKYQWLNDLLVLPAIGLLVPYERFRTSHLAHHFDPNLTDPYDDPESNFVDPDIWARFSPPVKALHRFNNTLAGRMAVGPAISLTALYRDDVKALIAGNRDIWSSYWRHGIGLLIVVLWHTAYSSLPVWAYLLAAYLGLSLLKIRTFLEHRAHERVGARNVIIEDRGPLSWLFLNNNFHAVHHAHPGVPWYRLPALFSTRRAAFLRHNGSYRYRSYGEVIARYLFTIKDPVPHPLRQAGKTRKADKTQYGKPRRTATATKP